MISGYDEATRIQKESTNNLKYVGNDPNWTLDEWLLFITNLIEKYGGKAKLSTNAGYNNVTLYLKTKK